MSEPEMVERVARAMHRKAHGTARGWRSLVPEARAAIEAMREPTDSMSVNGGLELEEQMFAQQGLVFDGAKAVFRTMIDAALAEPTAPR